MPHGVLRSLHCTVADGVPDLQRSASRTPRQPGAGLTSHYVHGTDPDEQRRLSRLNDILNERALRELGLAGGERILDLGCGLGQLARRMARLAGPGGRVVGVDRSAEQLARARELAAAAGEMDLVEFRTGDVLALELPAAEWGAYDVVHTRFVLEHVPDPLRVVRGMVRAARPGGRVVLEDEDHELLRLWPEVPGFDAVWTGYQAGYTRAGNDPAVGRKLVALLHEAGARPGRRTCIDFGAGAGEPHFADMVANLIGVLRGAEADVLAGGAVSATDFAGVLAALAAWGRRPDAALWFTMAWAEGIRPGS